MSTSSTLKLALELAAKVTGREELAALAGEVQQLGPISDETAAETARLAQTLETLSQQQALIQQFNQSADALTQLELASVLSRDKLSQLRAEQQAGTGQARVLTDQERLLASEVKQLERQLVARWHFIRPLLSQGPPLIYQSMKSRFNPLLNVFQTR